MQIQRTAMSVADFLDSVADQEAANGNDTNADIYRTRALEAKAQERALQQTQAELQSARDKLADIRRTAQVSA